MIIVKVWGGIGNQLFQYVFGQYLKHKYNQEVCYDSNSFIFTDKLRKPELYAIDDNIKYDNRCKFSKTRGVKNRVLRTLFQINPMHHYIAESSPIPSTFEANNLYFFQGYWQDIRYYEWLHRNVPSFKIQSQEWPKELEDIRKRIVSTDNSVSIHIRRGDYFKPENVKTFGVCDKAYFENALNSLTSQIPETTLFIFSDDLQWVKENLMLPSDSVFIPNYEVSQFSYIELMSLCKHHIISNSSFSWWGAVINEDIDSITIAPYKWLLTSEHTIALNKWLKIR